MLRLELLPLRWLWLLFEFDAAEMVMIGSGAGIGRGARVVFGLAWSVLLNVLAADLRLRLDFGVGLRESGDGRRPVREPWLPSSSDQHDLSIFSPIRGVAETARGCTGALALVRACMGENRMC